MFLRKRTTNLAKNERLEDFGIRQTMGPKERKAEYAKQCKALPQDQQGRFWMDVLQKDPEVAKIVTFKRVVRA
jgi:hypothetical protein